MVGWRARHRHGLPRGHVHHHVLRLLVRRDERPNVLRNAARDPSLLLHDAVLSLPDGDDISALLSALVVQGPPQLHIPPAARERWYSASGLALQARHQADHTKALHLPLGPHGDSAPDGNIPDHLWQCAKLALGP